MKRMPLLALLAAIAFAGACGRAGPEPSPAGPTWDGVQQLKQQASDAPATTADEARQRWADALREFVSQHPDHAEAGREWDALALEFARMLAARGRYRAAVPYFDVVLERNPDNESVAAELAQARERMALTPETLALIEKEMDQDEVREKIGPPQPGWTRMIRKGDHSVEAWFYPGEDGSTVSIHFVDGKVFALETGS